MKVPNETAYWPDLLVALQRAGITSDQVRSLKVNRSDTELTLVGIGPFALKVVAEWFCRRYEVTYTLHAASATVHFD